MFSPMIILWNGFVWEYTPVLGQAGTNTTVASAAAAVAAVANNIDTAAAAVAARDWGSHVNPWFQNTNILRDR